MSGCNLSHNEEQNGGGSNSHRTLIQEARHIPTLGRCHQVGPKWAQTLWFSLGLARNRYKDACKDKGFTTAEPLNQAMLGKGDFD